MNQGIGHMYVDPKQFQLNLIIIAVYYAYEQPEDFRLRPSNIVYTSSFCFWVIHVATLHYYFHYFSVIVGYSGPSQV